MGHGGKVLPDRHSVTPVHPVQLNSRSRVGISQFHILRVYRVSVKTWMSDRLAGASGRAGPTSRPEAPVLRSRGYAYAALCSIHAEWRIRTSPPIPGSLSSIRIGIIQ